MTSPAQVRVAEDRQQLRPAETIALLLLTAGAAAMRWLFLSARSFTLDEGFSAYLAATTARDFHLHIWHGEFNMVLYYALLRWWARLGSSEFVLRSLSVVLAAATIPVIYFLGRRLFGRSTALAAALLLAIHPSHLALAQQARSYALLILLVALSSLFFLRVLQLPSWLNGAGYAVFSAAAVYSHFFAGLVIVAQWLSLLFRQGEPLPRKRLLTALALLLCLLAPAGIFLGHSGTGNVAWVTRPNLPQVLDVLYSLTLSKARSLTYLALWAVALWQAFRASTPGERWPYRFVATWLLLPPAVTLAASFVQPLLVPRFLSVCIPAAVLLAAAGLTQVARWSRPAAAAVLVLLAIYSFSAIRFYDRHPQFDQDWRGVSQYILSHAQAGDEVVMSGYAQYTFDYYRARSGEKAMPLRLTTSGTPPLPEPAPENVWFMGFVKPNSPDSNPAPRSPESEAFQAAYGQFYCAAGAHPGYGVIRVWQFQRCEGRR